MTALLCLIFFLSGAAALLFETLWFHQAGLALGNSVWASSVVLAGFMGGLALGNGLAARLGDRVSRPLRAYAVFELAIGLTGVALVVGIPALGPLLAPALRPVLDQPLVTSAIRLAVAFGLLLVPSTAMGATLPLLVSELVGVDPHFGRALGRLYGWNTLGATLGAVCGQVALFAWLGIRGSAAAAAGVNVLAALGALALERLVADGARRARPAPGPRTPLPARALPLLLAAALCGGTLLALEVVWFRFLILFTLPGSLAFASMLAVVLAGIGLGGLLAAPLLGRFPAAPRALPTLAALAGALCIASWSLFDGLVRNLPPPLFQVAWIVVVLGVFLMLPVSLVSGLLFAFLGQAIHAEGPAEARATGLLTLANTSGAALGSLAGGFWLLPRLGIERSVRFLAVAYGVTAVCLLAARVRPRRPVGRAALAAAALVLATTAGPLFPRGQMERYLGYVLRRFSAAQERPVVFRETLTETILYLRAELFGQTRHWRLVTNSHSMSSTAWQTQRYMRLFVWLPVALHPAPRDALLISYGVGVTAKALTDTRELQRIDMVDISRDILELNRLVFPAAGEYPPADPRVRVHIEDGRYFLQTTDRRFDLITGEPPPPKAAGIVNLYTREFFGLARERLREGGILSYWLPVHMLEERETLAIVRGFCDVFEDCSLWSGSGLDWILLGTRHATGPGSVERFAAQWRDPRVATALRELGFERPEQMGATFMAGPEDLAALTRGVPPLDDDHPKRLGESFVGADAQERAYRSWLDAERNRQRFEQSALVARLWPAELRAGTLPYFTQEALIEKRLSSDLGRPRDAGYDMPRVDAVLRETPLQTLVLWELGTNADIQRCAREAALKGARGPALDFEAGARALAERRFADAALRFGAAWRASPQFRDALHWELYALALAGRTDEARALAEREGVIRAARTGDREVWDFLSKRFATAASPLSPAPPRLAGEGASRDATGDLPARSGP